MKFEAFCEASIELDGASLIMTLFARLRTDFADCAAPFYLLLKISLFFSTVLEGVLVGVF